MKQILSYLYQRNRRRFPGACTVFSILPDCSFPLNSPTLRHPVFQPSLFSCCHRAYLPVFHPDHKLPVINLCDIVCIYKVGAVASVKPLVQLFFDISKLPWELQEPLPGMEGDLVDVIGSFKKEDLVIADGNGTVRLPEEKFPHLAVCRGGLFLLYIQQAVVDLPLDILCTAFYDEIQGLYLVLEGQKSHF